MKNERILLRDGNNDIYMDVCIIDDPWGLSRKRPIVVICPGGGYQRCSSSEAEPIAMNFNAAGFHTAIVYYSVNKKYPEALKDLSEAVIKIRSNCENWCIDKERVILCGFSAGGHLAASLGVLWDKEPAIKCNDESNKPDGMILAYPVITATEKRHKGSIEVLTDNDAELMKQVSLENYVTSACPPTFIWHTFEDKTVPVENSVYLLNELIKENIPTEFHIYPKGKHGLSLANQFVAKSEIEVVPEVQEWIKNAVRWIKNYDYK